MFGLGFGAGRHERRQPLNAGLGQFEAHQARHRAADDPGHDREDQIERADVLVVGREKPARQKRRLVVMRVVMRVVVTAPPGVRAVRMAVVRMIVRHE